MLIDNPYDKYYAWKSLKERVEDVYNWAHEDSPDKQEKPYYDMLDRLLARDMDFMERHLNELALELDVYEAAQRREAVM